MAFGMPKTGCRHVWVGAVFMKLEDDDFELFGLPRRFALDRLKLDARWRALQAEVHPDRFASEGTVSQRVAMQWAVRVNEAYRRLKDPLTRAAYLCELAGAAVDTHDNQAMPKAFLMQQMQWREALADAQDPAAIEALMGEVAAQSHALEDEVRLDLDERGDVAAAGQRVRAMMFLARFRSDVNRRLEALEL
jgi:molecular chaperone HscB